MLQSQAQPAHGAGGTAGRGGAPARAACMRLRVLRGEAQQHRVAAGGGRVAPLGLWLRFPQWCASHARFCAVPTSSKTVTAPSTVPHKALYWAYISNKWLPKPNKHTKVVQCL